MAAALSGTNITPNWQTAASNEQLGNGRAEASACCQITFSRSPNFGFANSNMSGFKSVATISIIGRQGVAQSTRYDSRATGNFKNAFVFLAREPQEQIFGP